MAIIVCSVNVSDAGRLTHYEDSFIIFNSRRGGEIGVSYSQKRDQAKVEFPSFRDAG